MRRGRPVAEPVAGTAGFALVPGETVGNKVPGFWVEVPTPGRVVRVPGPVGSVDGGRAGSVDGGWAGSVDGGWAGLGGAGERLGAEVISTDVVALKEAAWVPLTVAVSVTLAPADAARATLTLARSSSD